MRSHHLIPFCVSLLLGMEALSGATPPPLAPAISSANVSEVNSSSALFTAVVNANGNKTTGAFEFRVSGSRRWVKSSSITLVGNGPQTVRRRVETLLAHSNYEWRLVVKNRGGTSTFPTAVPAGQFTTLNLGPVVSDDRAAIGAGGGAIAVLQNDSDPDRDQLVITAVSGGTRGTLATDGKTVTYTPGPTFAGYDTFIYTVSDVLPDGMDALRKTATATVDVVNLDLAATILASTMRSHGSSKLAGGGGRIANLSVPAVAGTGELALAGKSGVGSRSQRFVAVGSPMKVLAAEGKLAPGAAGLLFGAFSDPVIGAGGTVAFKAELTGRSATRGGNEGIWTNLGGTLTLVARKGDQSPYGTEQQPVSYKTLRELSIQGNEVLFVAELAGPNINPANDTAVFVWTPELGAVPMIREGTPVTVAPATTRVVSGIRILNVAIKSPGQARSHPAEGLYILIANFTDGSSALLAPLRAPDGSFSFGVAALTQATLPGLPTVTAQRFGVPSVTGTDIIGFRARVSGAGVPGGKADGLFIESGAIYQALGFTGNPAPGVGALYSRFFDPVFNSAGDVAWIASLKGGAAGQNEGLWLRKTGSGAPKLLVQKGTAIQGRANSTWRSIRSVVLPDATGPVFVASSRITYSPTQKVTSEGLWSYGSDGGLRLILTRGDRLAFGRKIQTIRNFNVLGRVSGSPDSPRAYERLGQIVCLVGFSDGEEAVLSLPLL